MYTLRRSKLALLLIIAFVACAPDSGHQTTQTTRSESNELAETQWVLLSYGSPDAEIALVEGNLITLEFGAEGQVAGSSICNSYVAEYDVHEDTLMFVNVTSAQIPCEGNTVTQQEADYLQALKSASTFQLSGDTLIIAYNGGSATLTLMRV